MSTVRGREYFDLMHDPNFPLENVEGFARRIRAWVASDETNWTELGFTDDQLTESLREAKVREGKKGFCWMLLHPPFSVEKARGIVRRIRAWVANGETNWAELGFSDDQLENRLQMVRAGQ
ncbi:MAG: hypothetical protein WDZ79_02055 [Candidatus Paceibacterota bacterium]